MPCVEVNGIRCHDVLNIKHKTKRKCAASQPHIWKFLEYGNHFPFLKYKFIGSDKDISITYWFAFFYISMLQRLFHFL